MADETLFHLGEQQVQRRAGVHDQIGPWARKVVRDFLPEQHRDFYAGLPFLVAAARDERGRPWATVLAGPPGFSHSPDPRRLEIQARPVAGDALARAFSPGAALGLLGIELATRRRNRVNGRVSAAGDGVVELEVGQSFGNCPQYIREREWQPVAPPVAPRPALRGQALTPSMQEWIARADTFFIASGHPGGDASGRHASHGMDASHRGGEPGFVEVASPRRLVFPDYAGNNHFNTLGNLVADPRAGLLFLDFASGSMLQLTGRATIDWDSPAVAEHDGARRLVVFDLDEANLLPEALPLRWVDEADSVRSLVLVEKRPESDDVTSFVFEARDGAVLPDYEPGQHLPVEIPAAGCGAPVRRTYSLSRAPGDRGYRISVKREPLGTGSRLLHDELEVGDCVGSRPPAGDFVLAPGARPVVLVSAGIGVTPMQSMLDHLVATEDPRRVVFVHVARDGRHHPLAAETRARIAAGGPRALHVFYSRPGADDELGRDFDVAGRLDAETLSALLPDEPCDVYLCGPVAFMAEMQAGLELRGVPATDIHSESFGPRH